MKRYHIASLLFVTTVIALLLAFCRPFNPKLTVFDVVDLDRRHSYNVDAKHYELTVANSGTWPVWLPDPTDPAADITFGNDPLTEDFTAVGIVFGDRSPKRLDPGQGFLYNLYVTARFRKIDVGIDVQNWRGRQARYRTQIRFVE